MSTIFEKDLLGRGSNDITCQVFMPCGDKRENPKLTQMEEIFFQKNVLGNLQTLL